MNDILKTTYFLNFVVPLITVFLTVFVKIVSRNDQYYTFKKEDLAIGMDISVTALIIFITSAVNYAAQANTKTNELINSKLVDLPWLILAFVCIIWFVSTIIRKFGWHNKDELNILWGIIIPDFIGIMLLLFVVNWIG